MSFNPAGGALSGATDVAISSPANDQVLTYDSTTSKWKNKNPGSGAGKRSAYLLVASAQAPANVKAAADYICTGVGDQTMINNAITAAAVQPNPATSFSSIGGNGTVVLSAGAFDINTPILMKTGVVLEGQGMLTELRARSISSGAQSIIALADTGVHLTRVTNMWLNCNSTAGSAHGIHYVNTGSTYTTRPVTNPDASHFIDHLYIYATAASGSARHGIWTEGGSGGARASKVSQIRMFLINGTGVLFQGSSDSHITDVELSTEGSANSGYVIASGNCILTSCKAYYCEMDGFQISSSRATLTNCSAQDNGRWGFNVTGGSATIVGGQADSNQRVDNSGGGLVIGASGGSIVGMSIFDRAQSTQQQTRGIQFNGTPTNMRLDATVSLPSGSNHVVGTYTGTGNAISVVRSGTTPISQGY